MRSALWGRSPLTRGRPRVMWAASARVRSIPAHAGQTQPGNANAPPPRVDPRSRGADSKCEPSPGIGSGRSPLTRGRLQHLRHHGLRLGSIPAHAGQTVCWRRPSGSTRVDPRSRGADVTPPGSLRRPMGRSPLTRGRPANSGAGDIAIGSIPAHAGQTRSAASDMSA